MSSCHHTSETEHKHDCHTSSFDYLLWTCLFIIAVSYVLFLTLGKHIRLESLHHFFMSIYEIMNSMWWGMLAGIFFVGLMKHIPSAKVQMLLGKPGSKGSVLKAALAGVLLDLCSHGILLVGMNLYKKGISLGQLMAFLISSPWNSFSLTFKYIFPSF